MPCLWICEDDNSCYFVTDCDCSFQFPFGGPEDHSFNFCPFCGKKIKVEKE